MHMMFSQTNKWRERERVGVTMHLVGLYANGALLLLQKKINLQS